MTEHERDPEATGPEGATDETDAADAATDADDGDSELEEAEELEAAEDLGDADLEPEPEAAVEPTEPGRAAAAAVPGAGARRMRGRPPVKAAAPSVSELAVKVSDRASAAFVLGLTGLFAAILVYGMLFGHAGFLSALFPPPTPAPTASPVVSASPSASASTPASASPAASGSPAASPSSAASPSPAQSPAASPVASESPAAAASPSPSPS